MYLDGCHCLPSPGTEVRFMAQNHILVLSGRNSVEAQPGLISSSVSASDSTTTIRKFGKTKLVPNQMHHLLPMLAGSRESSFALQEGTSLGVRHHMKTMNITAAAGFR